MNQLKEHIEGGTYEEWEVRLVSFIREIGIDDHIPALVSLIRHEKTRTQLSLIEKIIAMVEGMELETGLSPMARFGMDAISMDAFMTSRGYISQFDARREHNQALAALKSKLKELL